MKKGITIDVLVGNIIAAMIRILSDSREDKARFSLHCHFLCFEWNQELIALNVAKQFSVFGKQAAESHTVILSAYDIYIPVRVTADCLTFPCMLSGNLITKAFPHPVTTPDHFLKYRF